MNKQPFTPDLWSKMLAFLESAPNGQIRLDVKDHVIVGYKMIEIGRVRGDPDQQTAPQANRSGSLV